MTTTDIAAAAVTRARVPFTDLGLDEDLASDILAEFRRLIVSAAYVNGPAVEEFEAAFSAYCGSSYCVGVSSGLDALRLGLVAAGLEPGEEVVVPASTFVATAEAVTQAGGVPVLVDVSEADYGVDPGAVDAAAGARTRAVVPVHLYGQMADLTALGAVADRHHLTVIEDACQAHGAERDGRRAGSIGLAGAFSFYPAKNLGAFGDAGALVTDSRELADSARAMREHGQRKKYEHHVQGYTARLDTIQAIVLIHKLALLDEANRERQEAAAYYLEALDGVGDLRLPRVPVGSDPVWHLFVIETRDPFSLASSLREIGIQTGRHYPYPIHLTAAYAHLGYRDGAFPVSERLARRCLSLPIFPGISERQLESVAEAVREHFDGR